MSVSGSNFIWKTIKRTMNRNRKLFKCPRHITRAFGSFFSENSFFLNSDSMVINKRFEKNFKKGLHFQKGCAILNKLFGGDEEKRVRRWRAKTPEKNS